MKKTQSAWLQGPPIFAARGKIATSAPRGGRVALPRRMRHILAASGLDGDVMKRRLPILALFALTLPATAALAQPAGRPAAFEALVRCRGIADAAARLACFDGAVASFEAATTARDVVVVDRAQIKESKRTLFGLAIPKLPLFGDDREEDEVKSIEGVVESARRDGDGRWIVRLKDGGTWRQIDSNPLGRSPRSGMAVQINRAAIGSFKMRVAGQPGIKVRREI